MLSGMELFGSLLSGGYKNERAFNYFWDNYWTKVNPLYNSEVLKDIFRNSIRGGTAHYFLVKFGIQISKENKNNLTKTKEDNLNIDLVVMYEDFRRVFFFIKGELLKDIDSEMTKKFLKGYDELVKEMKYSKIAVEKYISNIADYQREEPTTVFRTAANFATVSQKVINYSANASTTTLPMDSKSNKK
jgi:hypothetical protein